MSLAAGTRLGAYEIVALIGAGGMGEIYRARDTRLDRAVAIKILAAPLAADAQLRERFDREARAISSLNHSISSGWYRETPMQLCPHHRRCDRAALHGRSPRSLSSR